MTVNNQEKNKVKKYRYNRHKQQFSKNRYHHKKKSKYFKPKSANNDLPTEKSTTS